MKSWPEELTVAPIRGARGVVRLPGSKSLSNRALLLAALADGQTELAGLLDADDTRVMIAALRALGIRIDAVASATGAEGAPEITRVTGCRGRWPARAADLHLGNAGTAMRSLAAALAFAGGQYRLDGVPRMRERPIGDLVDALNALGADVRYEARAGYPPLLIGAAALGGRDRVEVRGEVSSQFVSGLLMAAPAIAPPGGLTIEVPGPLISQPYVSMTLALMRHFGVDVAREAGAARFRVPHATYVSPGRYDVEGDASGASYFLALGALAGGPVRVTGAGRRSVQGDIAFAQLLEQMGARVTWGDDWIESAAGEPLQGGTFDCAAIPDAAMTAAIVGLFANSRTELRGIGSWRVKETDRIAAMAAELARIGARVDSGADWLAVEPPTAWRSATIDTYDDHRMAMCFSLAACGGVPVRIRDPRCVEKTYPRYFDELELLTRAAST